jgi:hypothetical protein
MSYGAGEYNNEMEQKALVDTSRNIRIAHARSRAQLTACYPVISLLRPSLATATDWLERYFQMSGHGYRVLAAWDGEGVVAIAGYRRMENLIHNRFIYVDDLVTVEERRGEGLGAALLEELASIGIDEGCQRLVLDTAASNVSAQRFYKREGLSDLVAGFLKPLVNVS